MINPSDFVRFAVDPVRLAILGRAASGPVEAASLAGELDVHLKQVLLGIVRLREAGLLTDGNTLDRGTLRELARSLPDDVDVDPAVVDGPWSAEEVQVLSKFFEGSKRRRFPRTIRSDW